MRFSDSTSLLRSLNDSESEGARAVIGQTEMPHKGSRFFGRGGGGRGGSVGGRGGGRSPIFRALNAHRFALARPTMRLRGVSQRRGGGGIGRGYGRPGRSAAAIMARFKRLVASREVQHGVLPLSRVRMGQGRSSRKTPRSDIGRTKFGSGDREASHTVSFRVVHAIESLLPGGLSKRRTEGIQRALNDDSNVRMKTKDGNRITDEKIDRAIAAAIAGGRQ